VLEIGISHGGSLQMWKHYFGPEAIIHGVDINPNCKELEEERIRIFIGDQADRSFLQSLVEAVPKVDILIDDGGHRMDQQINTFEVLFPHVSLDGVYFCEDLHTSYWPKFGGSYGRRSSFVEYSKNFIDSINAWHSKQPRKLSVSEFTRSVRSLHYYDSVLVIEKGLVEQPYYLRSGERTIARYRKPTFVRRLRKWLHDLAARRRTHG
jgi:hypothetical protein